MISVLLLRETLVVENQLSSNFWDKEFLKPNGFKNLFLSGKILVESKSICFKNTTQSLKDGDSPSKYMPSSQELKSFNKPCKDILTNWKFLREVFSLINTFFQNLWKIMGTWTKVNTRSLNVCTAVLNQWLLRKRQKLFIWDAHLKNAMKEQSRDKEHNKMKFLCNICKRFT